MNTYKKGGSNSILKCKLALILKCWYEQQGKITNTNFTNSAFKQYQQKTMNKASANDYQLAIQSVSRSKLDKNKHRFYLIIKTLN